MAEMQVLTFPGGTQEQYDSVSRAMGMDQPNAEMAKGLRGHWAGPTDDGDWCVVDEWESRDDFNRFFEMKLKAAFEQVGMPKPEISWFRTHHGGEFGAARPPIERAA